MNAEKKSVSAGIRILGVFSIIAALICFVIGGGVLFSMLSKGFMASETLIVSLFLMISGILKCGRLS